MAWNNLVFRCTEEDSVLCLGASTQTLCLGNFKLSAAPSSDLLCRRNGSYMYQTPHWIFLKVWLHSTTELIQQLRSADRRGSRSRHPSQHTLDSEPLQSGASRNSPPQRLGFYKIGNKTASLQDFLLTYLSQVVLLRRITVIFIKITDLWNKLYCQMLSEPRSLLRLNISLFGGESKYASVSSGNKWEFSKWNAQHKPGYIF